MGLAELARAQQSRQRMLAERLAAAAASRWALVDAADVGGSWTALLGPVVAAVTVGQRLGAASGVEYADRAAAAQDAPEPDGAVQPGALAETAADGRPLGGALFTPVLVVRARTGAGMALSDALAVGGERLRRVVATEVHDAARVATGLGIVTRRGMGYARMLTPPSCARCAVLAGRVYGSSQAFQRHPRCDCVHIPAMEAGDHRTDPRGYFDGLDAAEQDRVFGKAGAEAVRAGADLGQVVNARRGMYTAAGRSFTSEGTTRRGLAGQQLGRTPRLMPEQIYAEAAGDRAEALRLLRRHGYIT